MLNRSEILETIEMIDKEHFDVRTITMGLSLFSCIRQTAKETAKCVYDLICRRAEKLVRTGEDIESEFGIPIVNKRISVTPIALVAGTGVRRSDRQQAHFDHPGQFSDRKFSGGRSGPRAGARPGGKDGGRGFSGRIFRARP